MTGNHPWVGCRPVRRLAKHGRVGEHVTTRDGRWWVWTDRHGWVKVWPAPPLDAQETGK